MINLNEQTLKIEIGNILLDLGKNIKIHKINDENTILDVPYQEYIDKIVDLVKQYNQ